jgi:glycosyltransferase involved in cell wall biosynthesis
LDIEVSVIIPAYNEEELLPQTLDSLKNSLSHIDAVYEIIVVDNNSSDKTAEAAEEAGVKVVFEKINQISRARNCGAEAASGKYLFFIDADSNPPCELIRKALEALRSNTCRAGGAQVEFDELTHKIHLSTVKGWNSISKFFKLAAGCFIYCRRDVFEAVGGFSTKYFAGEEIFFSRAVKKELKKQGGEFLIIEDPKVLTSARKLKWFSAKQQILMVLSFIFIPITIRFRSLCSFWYKRPENFNHKKPNSGASRNP